MKKLYITKGHIIIEILSFVLLGVSFIVAVVGMMNLPAEIATHYDFQGNATGYGSPAVLLLMPGMMLFTNLIISGLIHLMKADSWNMPFKVKETRKILVYRDMVSMNVWLEFEIALFTLVFTIMGYRQEMGGAMILTGLLMVAVMGTIIGFCVLSAKHNK